jgi:hypothetical protein
LSAQIASPNVRLWAKAEWLGLKVRRHGRTRDALVSFSFCRVELDAAKQQVKVFSAHIECFAKVSECQIDVCGVRYAQFGRSKLVARYRYGTVWI